MGIPLTNCVSDLTLPHLAHNSRVPESLGRLQVTLTPGLSRPQVYLGWTEGPALCCHPHFCPHPATPQSPPTPQSWRSGR